MQLHGETPGYPPRHFTATATYSGIASSLISSRFTCVRRSRPLISTDTVDSSGSPSVPGGPGYSTQPCYSWINLRLFHPRIRPTRQLWILTVQLPHLLVARNASAKLMTSRPSAAISPRQIRNRTAQSAAANTYNPAIITLLMTQRPCSLAMSAVRRDHATCRISIFAMLR